MLGQTRGILRVCCHPGVPPLSFIPRKARLKLDRGETAFYVWVMTAAERFVALSSERFKRAAHDSPINTRVFHIFHSHVGNAQINYYGRLTLGKAVVRLQMVRDFLKVTGHAGDSQLGLKYSQVQIL